MFALISALDTGVKMTVDRPKAEQARPEARPRLWGSHFWMQEMHAP